VKCQSSHARAFSAIIVRIQPVSEGTTPDLASSEHTQYCLAIAARRTRDFAEIDAELVNLLELTQVTLHVYVGGTDSG
jgi:hypothetical protein